MHLRIVLDEKTHGEIRYRLVESERKDSNPNRKFGYGSAAIFDGKRCGVFARLGTVRDECRDPELTRFILADHLGVPAFKNDRNANVELLLQAEQWKLRRCTNLGADVRFLTRCLVAEWAERNLVFARFLQVVEADREGLILTLRRLHGESYRPLLRLAVGENIGSDRPRIGNETALGVLLVRRDDELLGKMRGQNLDVPVVPSRVILEHHLPGFGALDEALVLVLRLLREHASLGGERSFRSIDCRGLRRTTRREHYGETGDKRK